MKKIILFTIFLVLTFTTSAFAKPNSTDLTIAKSLSTKLSGEDTAYDPNSIRVLASTTFTTQVKDKNNKMVDTNVRAMFVEYHLINDTIFVKTHKEVFFYDETNKTFLDANSMDKVSAATQFKDQYKNETGTAVHYTGPLLIMIGLLLGVFLVLRYTEKNFYLSSTPRSL